MQGEFPRRAMSSWQGRGDGYAHGCRPQAPSQDHPGTSNPTAHPQRFPKTMWQLFKEFLMFLRQEKKWWLTPLVVILLLLAAVIVFTGGSVLAPLMYPFL
jgi:hypothetical protein